MYWVYIIQCNDGSLYTGITNQLERRWQQHQAGTASRYTRARGVKTMLYTERKRTKGHALKREYAIKQLSRQAKLQLCHA